MSEQKPEDKWDGQTQRGWKTVPGRGEPWAKARREGSMVSRELSEFRGKWGDAGRYLDMGGRAGAGAGRAR